jgi:hypothetical protein
VAPRASIRGEELEIANGATAKVREEEEERKRGRRKRAHSVLVGQSLRLDWRDLVTPCRCDSGKCHSVAPCALM